MNAPRRLPLSIAAPLGAAAFVTALATPAFAGDFDGQGAYVKDPASAAFVGFETDPERYVPADADAACMPAGFTIVKADDALEGGSFARLKVVSDKGCAERFLVSIPPGKGSYRFTAWTRHGRAGMNVRVYYKEGSNLAFRSAVFGPTGRTTSDGWVEMASNPVSIDGGELDKAYLRIADFASSEGTDLDALEVVPAGDFQPHVACAGAFDPVCGPESVCVHGQCASGDIAVPPLPDAGVRDEVVDVLAGRLRIYFGGARSRKEQLPAALATVESMRKAETPWQFWGRFAKAIRQLSDWHTSMGLPLGGDPRYRLNACFFEGDADLSHTIWPKDAEYPDILVSHVGNGGTAGLHAGDRLLAVDGQHPIAWARSLIEVDPGFHAATDPNTHAEFAESLGGPFWGGGLIIKYARSITVLRCDAQAGTCAHQPETIAVSSLTDGSGNDVACDNRPFYHIDGDGAPEDNHFVFWQIHSGKVKDTTPEEAIYGVVWDNLWGGGDPNGYVNGTFKQLIADWTAGARGVILDHRAGNGGTLDAPTLITSLVRPPDVRAAVLMPMETSSYSGPHTPEEGLDLFTKFKKKTPYKVGSDSHVPDLPVALILHRDGSASDYLPLGMKGAPNVRLFGPHATAGAFSTFIQASYFGAFEMQFASGDTIGSDGVAHIGHGVEPDEVILPRQSDLLAGKDTLHEAALAWVRAHLKEAQ